jgi:hypothetical protein
MSERRWEIDRDALGRARAIVQVPGGRAVAYGEIEEDDARLIAAAPEMLGALGKWPCMRCNGDGDACGPGGMLVDCPECKGTGLHPTARAAIAKAKGRGDAPQA